MRMIVIAIIVVFLFGCATAHKINRINVGMLKQINFGMSKQEAINIMGKPVSVSAKEGVEYLNYPLLNYQLTTETASDGVVRVERIWDGTYTPYFVRIIDGKVDSYGKLDDFNSFDYPDMRIKTEEEELAEFEEKIINLLNNELMYTELMKLKELKEAGILTEEEFEREKREILNKY
jgi:hypothetical protein